jgi:hypothetical protein
LGPNLLK